MRLPCTPRTRRQPFRPISATYRGHSQRRSQGTPPAVSKTKVCDTQRGRRDCRFLLHVTDTGGGEGTSGALVLASLVSLLCRPAETGLAVIWSPSTSTMPCSCTEDTPAPAGDPR